MNIIITESQLKSLIDESFIDIDNPRSIKSKNINKIRKRLNTYHNGYIQKDPHYWRDDLEDDTIDDKEKIFRPNRDENIVKLNDNIRYYYDMIDMIIKQVKNNTYRSTYSFNLEKKERPQDEINDYKNLIKRDKLKLEKLKNKDTQ